MGEIKEGGEGGWMDELIGYGLIIGCGLTGCVKLGC